MLVASELDVFFSTTRLTLHHLLFFLSRGIFEYIKQASMLRIYGHCKFAYIKMEVLKITVHPEDDSIKVRWRIRAITGLKVFLNFWKFKIFKLQEAIERVDVLVFFYFH